MEKLKVKHDHTLTDIIKVGIFAIFLLLPLLVFAPTAFYYGFNEHAVAQEKTKQVPIYYESNEVNSENDLIAGNIYLFDATNYNFTTQEYIYIQDYVLTGTYTTSSTTTYLQVPYITCIGTRVDIRNNINGEDIAYIYNNSAKFYFVFNGFANTSTNFINYCFETDYKLVKEYTTETFTMSITDSMNNAWQNTWELPLFNWTGNNNFAFTINAMSYVFGISQNSCIANYINYLLTLTAIYVIFDIVIAVFVKLTHMFHE